MGPVFCEAAGMTVAVSAPLLWAIMKHMAGGQSSGMMLSCSSLITPAAAISG